MTDIDAGRPHVDAETTPTPAVVPLVDAATCFAQMERTIAGSARWVFWRDQGLAALDAHNRAKAEDESRRARLVAALADRVAPPTTIRDRVRGIGAAVGRIAIGPESLPE